MPFLTAFKKQICFVLLILAITSCQNDKVDIPEEFKIIEPIEFAYDRFDLKVKNYIDELSPREVIDTVSKVYPRFGNDYLSEILGLTSPFYSYEQNMGNQVAFFADQSNHLLFDTVAIIMGDLSPEITAFKKHFAYYESKFPKQKSPYLIFMNSGFSYQTTTYGNSDTILIGTDLFLGADFIYPPSIPNFVKHCYQREYMVPRVIQTLVRDQMKEVRPSKFIDIIIQNGIESYISSKLLPTTPPYLLTKYTEETYNWAVNNEGNIWQAFQREKYLFSSEYDKFKKHVEPSPNSPGMPPEAPGELGNFIGWQIVKKYMEENPTITLQQLSTTSDFYSILEKSRYKPE